ncbi:MAG: ribosome recycling factor [Elusimicrobia bacterium]|nr:ribosome recycling factor [Elusimicrobiota bacterium]
MTEIQENIKTLLSKTDAEMARTAQKLEGEFASLRTGRANPAMLDKIRVSCYGTQTPLKQIASVSIPEARTFEIKPWDPSLLLEIEKALQQSDLGIPPANDGKLIRLNLPSLTEERRRDLVKLARKMAEEYRIALRNLRRETLEKLKKCERQKEISEDDLEKQEQLVQKLTDGYSQKIDHILKAKEQEITTV